MKIVIASGIYSPDIGGPATYSRLIAREFNNRGIEVKVICYSDSKSVEMDEMVEVVRILRKYNKLIRYFLYFWNLLKIAKKADIIYAQGPLAAGLPVMLVSRILRKKFVVKIVGDYAWEQYCQRSIISLENPNFKFQIPKIEDFQNKKYNLKAEILRTIQKKVVKSADKIIVPSEYLKKLVKGWGIKEDKIKVIYNAVSEIKNVGRPTSPYYDDIGTSDVLISAGRLEPWKGMDTLVEIMPELLKENSNFRLIIIGRGPQEENIKFQITNLKLENKVKLIDRLPHRELLEYFKVSKIFVLNSGYEGFSHIVLEAMACELSVITTNVCGNPEIVKDGYNGLLVDYNNKTQLKEAILKLWKDKELQKKFIKNGKKTLEKFTLDKMISETIKFLKS